MQNKQFPFQVPDALHDCLNNLGHFIYYPNPGNLGDGLIAASTVSLFERMGLSYELYDERKHKHESFTLVYGGGGACVPEWGYLPQLQRVFSLPGLVRCIILPNSMRECFGVIELMDDRFTVFCRESRSLAYCLGINKRALFLPADDMAFYFSPLLMRPLDLFLARHPRPSFVGFCLAKYFGFRKKPVLSLAKFYRKTYDRMRRHLKQHVQFLPDGRRYAWFLRRDQERNPIIRDRLPKIGLMDIARYGGGDCRWHDLNMMDVSLFLEAIDSADVVITDRLHVGIAAAMLEKEVFLLDNSYGKIAGVYEYSMQQLLHVHFCHSCEELQDRLQQISGNSILL